MRVGEIWLTSAHSKWSDKATMSVEIVNDRDVDYVYVIEATSIPGIKGIMRPHGEPSDGTEAEASMVAEANKEDECRRPQRTIAHIKRSRPPTPAVTVKKPATIVIWSPAPWLVTDPSPSVVGLPNPSSSLIWSPRYSLVGLPNIPISRHVNPVSVTIQIIHASVITIGMAHAV